MAVILSISSQVVRGHVGNSASVIALGRLGHTVWALPTIVLSHHPGHGPGPRLVTPPVLMTEFVDALEARGWLGEVDAVIVGYLAAAEQATAAADAIGRVRALRPDAFVAVDPVMGDDGRLYVAEEIAAAIRDTLVPLADAITPNRFELAWICGAECDSTAEVVAAARALTSPETLVTSAPDAPPDHVRSLLVTPAAVFAADTERMAHRVHGVGDLMTSLYIGHRLSHKPPEEALRWATHGVLSVLDESMDRNSDELALMASQGNLTHPRGYVVFKRIF